MIDSGAEKEALLQPEKRHGRGRAHRHSVRPPRIGIEAARDIERQHRHGRGVHRVDRGSEGAADRARETRAEERIDDHVGAIERPRLERGQRDAGGAAIGRGLRGCSFEPLGRHHELNAHGTPGRLHEPREHEAVPGVVACAAHYAERTSPRPAAVNDAQGGGGSAAHELVVRDAAGLDRPLLQVANLRGAENTLGKSFCQGFHGPRLY